MPARIFHRLVADRTLAIYNPNSKASVGYVPILLISLLLISILVGLGSTAFAFNNSQVRQNQILNECQQLVEDAGRQGFQINSAGCEVNEVGLSTAFNADSLEKSYQNVRASFVQQKTLISTSLNSIESQISDLQKGLKLMQLEFPVFQVINSTNQNQLLKARQQYLNDLQVIDQMAQIQIQDLINQYQTLLNKAVGLNLAEFVIYIGEYKALSPIDQRKQYLSLQAKFQNLQNQIPQLLIILSQTDSIRAEAIQANFYQIFSGEQFKDLYNSQVYKYVEQPIGNVNIFGNTNADGRIVSIAESRGYLRRPQAQESRLVAGDSQNLQPEVIAAWEWLKAKADKEGIKLVMVSGYRSINQQRSIFLERFGNNFTVDQIASGQADNAINELLKTTSIPGYSRHHTGYTFDIGCNSTELVTFGKTPCFEWISKNNYLNAKLFGLIPSYPEEAEGQGPEPEAWEYVWVGEDILKN